MSEWRSEDEFSSRRLVCMLSTAARTHSEFKHNSRPLTNPKGLQTEREIEIGLVIMHLQTVGTRVNHDQSY